MATPKSTQTLLKPSSNAKAAAQAKQGRKPTPFSAIRPEALGHQKVGHWEQAARCWERAAGLARAGGHNKQANQRAAVCSMALRRMSKPQRLLELPRLDSPESRRDSRTVTALLRATRDYANDSLFNADRWIEQFEGRPIYYGQDELNSVDELLVEP